MARERMLMKIKQAQGRAAPATSFATELECSNCGTKYSIRQVQTFCKECQSALLTRYDLDAVRRHVDRDALGKRPAGMWRWYELLPVQDARHIVTLGEGDTPLLRAQRVGEELGLRNVFVKEEGKNPTGTFKARGLAAANSRARDLGIKKVIIPTAGNAGGAMAAYAARAGMKALIYMPKDTPRANILESQV